MHNIYSRGVESTKEHLLKMSGLRLHGLGCAEDYLADMGQRADTYPGDESVSVDYTEAMRYDPKGHGFPQLAIRCVLSSAHRCGADITPTVYEDVKRMAVGPEATDTYLDNCGHDPGERVRRHKLVIDSVQDIVDGTTNSAALHSLLAEAPLVYGGLVYYGNALHTMPNQARERIGQHAGHMLRASLDKFQASNLGEYAKSAYRESAHYAHMWATTVWARQAPEKQAMYEQYDTWIAKLLGGLLVVAAGFDIREDYDKGEITFRPWSFRYARANLIVRGIARTGPVIAGYRRLKKLKRA